MERHKQKARLVWALAQAAQQNFRHCLASTHTHKTRAYSGGISTRTSTRFIVLRTREQQTKATWNLGPSQGWRVCFLAKNRRWFCASHTTCAAASCGPTHINTYTTRLHGRRSPERHGGCKLFSTHF